MTSLYVLAVFVSNSVLSTAQLKEFKETAIVEVARSLIGNVGAMIVLFAGLLATLSSANASILSSSRTIYALSADGLVPTWISVIHDRFGTPHRALILVGLPIVGILFVGNLEVLAETASLLHLVIYGLICACVIKLRKTLPIWYVLSFKTPGFPVIPIVGLLASFGLIFFIQNTSLILGGVILSVSAIFYLIYARNKTLKIPSPPHIEPTLRKPRILLPISLPQEKSIPVGILNGFTDLEILLLGYKKLPEQTTPQQYEKEEGEESQQELENIKKQLEDESFDVKSELVFTQDVSKTIDNAILEHDCEGLFVVKPISKLKRLVIPVYDINQISKRFATVIYELTNASNLEATLLFLGNFENSDNHNNNDTSAMKKEALHQLKLAGIEDNQISSHLIQVDNISEAVKEKTESHDLVILVEANAKDQESFINKIREEIINKIDSPLLVILEKKEKEEKDRDDSVSKEVEKSDK